MSMNILSTISGSVFRIKVKRGEQVQAGDELVIMESMKMEIPLEAEAAGTVREIRVSEGDFVQEGDIVLIVD